MDPEIYENPQLEPPYGDPMDPPQEEAAEPRRAGMLQTAAYRGVLVFCAVYFFRPEDFWEPLVAIPIAKIVGIFTAIALLGAFLIEGVRLRREGKILLGLLAYLIVCIPFSRWPGGSMDIVIQVFAKGVVIALAAMACIANDKQLRRLMTVQALAMLMMSAIAVTQPKLQGRMYGTGNLFADPNDFALNLCIVLSFAVAILVSSRRVVGKLFWGGAIASIVAAIVLTGSRGGFLALVGTSFALWRRFRVGKAAGVAILVFLVMAALAAMLFLGGSSYFDRVSTITNINSDTTGSAEARWELLLLSLETTVKHPLFGIGPGQFENFSGSWHLTHNTYTEFSSEAGLPALGLFLFLVWSTFKNLRVRAADVRLRVLSDGLYGAMVGYIVGAFFLSTGYLFVPYLLIAYISAATRLAEETGIEAPNQQVADSTDEVDVSRWEEPQHEH
jgi:O-antigen ligase